MNKYTQYLKHLCLAAVMLATATTQDAEEIPITGEAFFTGSLRHAKRWHKHADIQQPYDLYFRSG